jgi:hypothetical protein
MVAEDQAVPSTNEQGNSMRACVHPGPLLVWTTVSQLIRERERAPPFQPFPTTPTHLFPRTCIATHEFGTWIRIKHEVYMNLQTTVQRRKRGRNQQASDRATNERRQTSHSHIPPPAQICRKRERKNAVKQPLFGLDVAKSM